jgi:hypothetical protein
MNMERPNNVVVVLFEIPSRRVCGLRFTVGRKDDGIYYLWDAMAWVVRVLARQNPRKVRTPVRPHYPSASIQKKNHLTSS